jgi:hypothetical protein
MVELRDGVWETVGEYSFDDVFTVIFPVIVRVLRLKNVPEVVGLHIFVDDLTKIEDRIPFKLAELIVHYPTGIVIHKTIPFLSMSERRWAEGVVLKLWPRITNIIDKQGGEK